MPARRPRGDSVSGPPCHCSCYHGRGSAAARFGSGGGSFGTPATCDARTRRRGGTLLTMNKANELAVVLAPPFLVETLAEFTIVASQA